MDPDNDIAGIPDRDWLDATRFRQRLRWDRFRHAMTFGWVVVLFGSALVHFMSGLVLVLYVAVVLIWLCFLAFTAVVKEGLIR